MRKGKPGVAPKSNKEVAIKVENLSKTFKIPLEASSGIKQKLINTLKGIKGYREFTPLNDISFEVNKGDFFGIVGRNGSGKSTLLKTMAGIYVPKSGSVTVNGSLVPFIELGVGFNPELTGRENVFLNGALLGFSHEEMEGMYKEIVDFAEIEEFMDEKLKNYSSGMQVRLAFSIAIQAKGDILLLDEVLAVGDEAFQRKCFNYFAELKREKKTVVLVTHDMGAVQQFCTKAMMIDKGRIVEYGNIMKVSHSYQELFINQENKQIKTKNKSSNNNIICSVKPIIKGQNLVIEVIVESNKELKETVVTVGINREDGEQVFRWISNDELGKLIHLKPKRKYHLKLSVDNVFPVGKYFIGVRLKNKDRSENYAIFDEIETVTINRRKNAYDWDTVWGLKHTALLEDSNE